MFTSVSKLAAHRQAGWWMRYSGGNSPKMALGGIRLYRFPLRRSLLAEFYRRFLTNASSKVDSPSVGSKQAASRVERGSLSHEGLVR